MLVLGFLLALSSFVLIHRKDLSAAKDTIQDERNARAVLEQKLEVRCLGFML